MYVPSCPNNLVNPWKAKNVCFIHMTHKGASMYLALLSLLGWMEVFQIKGNVERVDSEVFAIF